MCALPALALTQRHAAPELANARARHEASGRLAPFSGPKVRPEHVFCALEAALTADPMAACVILGGRGL